MGRAVDVTFGHVAQYAARYQPVLVQIAPNLVLVDQQHGRDVGVIGQRFAEESHTVRIVPVVVVERAGDEPPQPADGAVAHERIARQLQALQPIERELHGVQCEQCVPSHGNVDEVRVAVEKPYWEGRKGGIVVECQHLQLHQHVAGQPERVQLVQRAEAVVRDELDQIAGQVEMAQRPQVLQIAPVRYLQQLIVGQQ
uniref:Uncharacterized protein n=1 Tax=Anopheles coluzzii TaxID=1518534 RepID=A0A8W7PVY8_ANOCL